ncbi:MAG TPA: transcriptional repressor LexA [Patescibacteria group bacterium]|nr:transcriptional repressor LexA [Patescibacteria group bacterium]
MIKNLTPKQKKLLDFINDFYSDNGYYPSYREIANYFKLSSSSTVAAHITALKNKGYLETSFNKSRSIEIIPEQSEFQEEVHLYLAGLITAGEPIEAVEEKETISIPKWLGANNPAESYVLKVKGDSMIEEGILDGDYVIVERNNYPQDGEVVVALLDNSNATLKKFFREKDRIRLQPANSAMRPIYVKDPLIQGVVKGVMRKF